MFPGVCMNNVFIGDAVAGDLPAIAAILNEAIANTTSVWYDDPRTPDWMDAWFELKRAKGWPSGRRCAGSEYPI